MQIGGQLKAKKLKPIQPQFVVQLAEHLNEYAVLKTDEHGMLTLTWVGDPYAATKFNSKYEAKTRVRDIVDVPETRTFRELEQRKA